MLGETLGKDVREPAEEGSLLVTPGKRRKRSQVHFL